MFLLVSGKPGFTGVLPLTRHVTLGVMFSRISQHPYLRVGIITSTHLGWLFRGRLTLTR